MGISFWDVGVRNVGDILCIIVNHDPHHKMSGDYKVTATDEFGYVTHMIKQLSF